MINIKSTREIELMKETCKLASSVLEFIKPHVVEGVSTLELNDLCHQFIIDRGATPSPLNYHGFPKSICTSVNDVICHGIPSKKEVLRGGDIINIDITTYLNKFHGDTSQMFQIGEIAGEYKRLIDVTYQCLWAGINEVGPGKHIGDIGSVIEDIAHNHGYSIVEEYCGHGIGREFHEEPQIVHYGDMGDGIEMKPGMIFTIEPMVNFGKRNLKVLKDKWTVVTKDKKPSAQFEHTILVTEVGYEVLTLRSDEKIVSK